MHTPKRGPQKTMLDLQATSKLRSKLLQAGRNSRQAGAGQGGQVVQIDVPKVSVKWYLVVDYRGM